MISFSGSISNLNITSEDIMGSFVAPRKKRGRKSKAEKEAEARAAAEATIYTSYKRLIEMDIDEDVRIPMVDITVRGSPDSLLFVMERVSGWLEQLTATDGLSG